MTGRKNHKWLWISLGALLLAAVAVLSMFLFRGNTKEPAKPESAVLYWNVNRKDFLGLGADGDTGRMARSDGYYWVRLAMGGQQDDYPVANRALVQKMDQLDVMGLEFDKDGIIIGVRNVNECTGGLVASTLFVESVEGNILHCNTQSMYRGFAVDLEMTDKTEVYDVGQTHLLCGIASQVQPDDEIKAVLDYDGNLVYIFRAGYKEPNPVYWNLNRQYNATTGHTTRQLNSLGYYEFEMAFNGEVVTVRTRDMDVANAIDKKAARCTGLVFDEEGLVIGTTNASKEAGGQTFASWAHVDRVIEENIHAVKLSGSNAGEEFLGVLAKNCKIINTCGIGGPVGSYTQVRYGDQVHGLTDARGKICYLFIVSRLSGEDGYKLYWNFERKYDSVNKVTTRSPKADGYYYFDVATGGENLTVKTNDKALANKLDSYNARCFAMQIDADNNILGFQSAASIHGGSTFGSWYYVDKIDGRNLTVSRLLTGNTEPTVLEGVMAEAVEIINGTAVYSDHPGEYTQLKVGDRIHCLKDLNGKIRVIFVVEREVPGPVYWNIAKKAVKNGYTTRQRAEDGYFYFAMTAGGKQMTLKTKDITLATKIDNTAAKCMGLTVRNGVILKYHSASSVAGCQGGTKSESWVDVTKLSGRTYTARKDPNANVSTAGQYFTSTMASGCKIYNVSSNYNTYCGEPTTLRVGDRIHALHDRNGLTTVIFVVERKISLTQKNDCPCSANVIWQPWDGTTALENGKYYYLTADVTAPAEGFVLEGCNVSLRLDGHTIFSEGRCFYVKTDSRLNICDHETRGKLVGSGVDGEAGGVIRVSSASSTVNLWNVDACYQTGIGKVQEGGVISTSGVVSAYNCNFSGGVSSGVGGNVRVNATGTLRMFGGTMDAGKGSSGGNLYGSGRVYLEGAKLTNGAVAFNSKTDVILKDVTAQNAVLLGGTVKLQGVTLLDQLTITGGKLADGGIAAGSQITVTCKPETEQVIMTGASETAFKALQSFKPNAYSLSYNAKAKTVTVTNIITPQTHKADHCACAGNAQGMGTHTCQTLTDWTELTAEILVESPTAGNLAFPDSGNYYLSLDLELNASIDILPDQEITLCLNGCQITDAKRMFRINGTLNLTDCTGNGVASGSSALAPVFYTYAGGTLNLFGGTLKSTYSGSAAYWGGVGAVANDAGNAAQKAGSAVNMYGGTILGRKLNRPATGLNGGGAVMVMMSGTYDQVFTMYGGSIVGGFAESGGSAICAPGAGAIVNLLGGSIAADAQGMGGEVYVYGASPVTLGADVQVHILHLGEDTTVQLQNLHADAPAIGVRMDKPGAFAESETDLSGRFTGADEGYVVCYRDGKLRLDLQATGDDHVHCACGGTAIDAHTHQCSNLLYEPWDSGDSLPATSGNYYLTQDVVLTDPQGMLVGTNQINLCLNGYHITNNTGRAFYLKNAGGSLTLCNHADQNGIVSAVGVAGESGGVVRIGSGSATFTAYHVTMRRIDEGTRTAVTEGGIVQCSGKLSLYGCTLENGYAYKGGSINMSLSAKVLLVDSVVSGGVAVKDANSANGMGGNIHISGNNADNAATLELVNSQVVDGSAEAFGGDISLGAAQKNLLILGGKVTVDGLYLSDVGNVQIKDLDTTSVIGLAMKTNGEVGTADADVSSCFQSADDTLHVVYAEGKLILEEKNLQPQGHQNHCICAGAQAMPQEKNHSCQTVTWTGLTQAMFESATADSSPVRFDGTNYFLATGGYYYLQEDISVTKSIAVASGEEIALCLNGKNLHGQGVRTLYFQGTLHLCDCDYTDETVNAVTTRIYRGSVTTTVKSHAHIFYARSGATFYFYGGNLLGGKVGSSFTSNSGTGMVGGSMYMFGGVISGGDCSANGKSGGNIRVDGTLEMYGGVISGGKAKEGGNLAIASAATVILKGGILEKGEAVNGGNITAFGTLIVAEGAVIRDGVSTGTGAANGGGNIYGYPNNVDIRIEGGSIENGKAAKFGANLFLRGNSNGTSLAKLTIAGGRVDGIASGSGADAHNIYINKNNGLLEVSIEDHVQIADVYCNTPGIIE